MSPYQLAALRLIKREPVHNVAMDMPSTFKANAFQSYRVLNIVQFTSMWIQRACGIASGLLDARKYALNARSTTSWTITETVVQN